MLRILTYEAHGDEHFRTHLICLYDQKSWRYDMINPNTVDLGAMLAMTFGPVLFFIIIWAMTQKH